MNLPSLIQSIQPQRKIEGISAVLLPFHPDGQIDLDGFAAHLARTWAAGLTPAVNMDTGYVNLITPAERAQILALAGQQANGRSFVAGAFIEGEAGVSAGVEELVRLYRRETDAIQAHGGVPILFQCTALKALPDEEVIAVYRRAAESCERLLAFELGEMFASFGRIYSLEMVARIMEIPQVTGIKHSSLDRLLEWQRLDLRDRVRPDFRIYTGNDLGIDMVMYGSDYLLGLSTFAPDLFARRDAYWLAGDPRFHALNDALQYLGNFAFRAPTAAYKHSAAQFLRLRGWIAADAPHPAGPRRPESDLAVLEEILERFDGS